MTRSLVSIGLAAILWLALPAGLAAQPPLAHYILKDVGTLGGPSSQTFGNTAILNNGGTVVGGSDTADWNSVCGCPAFHAFKWSQNRLTDLGTLTKGADFSFALAINSFGTIAGVSANGVNDPTFGEAFVATVWRNGGITNLGTFGGPFSGPLAINDLGQIAGGAETTTPDSNQEWGVVSFGLPEPTLWHAALWQDGSIRDLGTLGGPAAFAYFINGRGQVAGQSYIRPRQAVQLPPTPLWEHGAPLVHPFLWENGRMTDIGTLGGVFAEAKAMNGLGQVVGDSDLRGGAAFHAFRWSQGKMLDLTPQDAVSAATAINDLGAVVGYFSAANGLDGFLWRDGVLTDLGALPGFVCSFPQHINTKGQVVGESDNCDGNWGAAWLWQDGIGLVDLNTLVPPGSDMYLVEPDFINDSGEIAGIGVLPNGDVHAFVLIPEGTGSDAATATSSAAVVGAAKTSDATPLDLSPAKLAQLRARRIHGAGPQSAP